MKAVAIKCASCGAALDVMSESTKIVRCKYCNYVNKINFKGETEILVEGDGSYKSNLRTFMNKRLKDWGLDLGVEISLAGKNFYVIGVIEYSYEDGFFYKFVLKSADDPMDKKDYFLSYDTEYWGLFTYEKRSGITYKNLKKAKLGASIKTEMGDKIVIDEKGEANIIGFAGELPFLVQEDETIEYYDGYFLNKDGLFTIDYTKGEKLAVYFGKEIDSGKIKIKKNT